MYRRCRWTRPAATTETLHATKGHTMPDLLWIAVTLGLAAATLAYVRLCDEA